MLIAKLVCTATCDMEGCDEKFVRESGAGPDVIGTSPSKMFETFPALIAQDGWVAMLFANGPAMHLCPGCAKRLPLGSGGISVEAKSQPAEKPNVNGVNKLPTNDFQQENTVLSKSNDAAKG